MNDGAIAVARDPYTTWQPELATMWAGDGHADLMIVPLVESLRAKGLTTLGSCQGHNEYECASKACADYPDLCADSHRGQLSVGARDLDPVSAMRVEAPCFTQIMCVTYPRFVWHFQWHSEDRVEAIDRLTALEPA